MIDVIIIGAGPAGLTLGAELASRGISCRIYEKRHERSISSRAIGLLSHTLELLDTRNLAEVMIQNGIIIEKIPLGDNGYLNLKKLHPYTKFPFMLSISQNQTEALLENWAVESGVEIIKGTTFQALHQYDNKVKVTLSDGENTWIEYSKYVIGCDGVNSTVCSKLNLSTKEIDYNKSLMHGDVRLKNLPDKSIFAKITRSGMIAAFPLPDNYYRVLVLDHEKMNILTDRQLTFEDFAESAKKLAKTDLGMDDYLWLSRFKVRQRHVSKYRVNRVFLVGDAAHGHMPAGGQGMQSAIEDAFNLGWKLASVLKADSLDTLLDSYEKERRQIAISAMRKSKFLFKYEISNTLLTYIFRRILCKISKIPILEQYLVRSLSGLTNYYKYSYKPSNYYIGKSVLNCHLCNQIGELSEIRYLLRNKKSIVFSNPGKTIKLVNKELLYGCDTVYAQGYFHEDRRIQSMIIRPDGVVAWASYN